MSGLVVASSVVACSSDPAAAPAGDDGDNSGDDDDDNAKKDAGSSSGSSGESEGGAEECNPIGTWTLPKPTYLVTMAGKVCDDFVKGAETKAEATEVVITKAEAGYQAESGGATLLLGAADEGECAIGGGLNPVGLDGIDADGNQIVAKFTPTQFYIFDGDRITSKINYAVESDPPGAKGTPCAITQVSNGTRKK